MDHERTFGGAAQQSGAVQSRNRRLLTDLGDWRHPEHAPAVGRSERGRCCCCCASVAGRKNLDETGEFEAAGIAPPLLSPEELRAFFFAGSCSRTSPPSVAGIRSVCI